MEIEVFKSGTWTDSAGNTRVWTEEDIDRIIGKYNSQKDHEAPVVIGHPKDNAPAYGWVENLYRKGNVLYAKLKDIAPEFVEWVKKGLYKKRSISLYPDMTLRHIGFLGAMPPAVKGLSDVAFSEAEAVTIEFSDYRIGTIGSIFQRLREWLIEKFDTETADKVVSNWDIEDLKREIKETEAEAASAFNEGGKEDMEKIQELEDKLKEKEKALAEFTEREQVKEEEIAKLRAEIAKIEKEKRQAEFNSFCEELIKEGRLTPAMKPAVMDFMEILEGVSEYEFSEGGKAKPVERFKSFLKALPKVVEFREIATKDKVSEAKTIDFETSGKIDEERMELHRRAVQFMEKTPGISYVDAIKKIVKEA